jgi:hypothetical protein
MSHEERAMQNACRRRSACVEKNSPLSQTDVCPTGQNQNQEQLHFDDRHSARKLHGCEGNWTHHKRQHLSLLDLHTLVVSFKNFVSLGHSFLGSWSARAPKP